MTKINNSDRLAKGIENEFKKCIETGRHLGAINELKLVKEHLLCVVNNTKQKALIYEYNELLEIIERRLVKLMKGCSK